MTITETPPATLPAEQAQQGTALAPDQAVPPAAEQPSAEANNLVVVDTAPVVVGEEKPAETDAVAQTTRESWWRRRSRQVRTAGRAAVRAMLDSDVPVARESIRIGADGTPYFVSVVESPEGLPNIYAKHPLRPNKGTARPLEELRNEDLPSQPQPTDEKREESPESEDIYRAVEAAEILDAMYTSDLRPDIDLSADPETVARLYAEAEEQVGVMKDIAVTKEGRAFLRDAFAQAGVPYVKPDAKSGESAIDQKYAPQLMLALQNSLHAMPEAYQKYNRRIIDGIDDTVTRNQLEQFKPREPSKYEVAARKAASGAKDRFSRAAKHAVKYFTSEKGYQQQGAGNAGTDAWTDGFAPDLDNVDNLNDIRVDADLREPVDPRPARPSEPRSRWRQARNEPLVDRNGVPFPEGPTDYTPEDDEAADRSSTQGSTTRRKGWTAQPETTASDRRRRRAALEPDDELADFEDDVAGVENAALTGRGDDLAAEDASIDALFREVLGEGVASRRESELATQRAASRLGAANVDQIGGRSGRRRRRRNDGVFYGGGDTEGRRGSVFTSSPAGRERDR